MKKILFLILGLVFVAGRLCAEQISLPPKDDKIYASFGTRAYDLKVKLKPKVVKSKVYWQGRERIDWQEEIKNWGIGLLSNEIIPPIIIGEENFYPEDEGYPGKYFWAQNNMRLLVFNPLSVELNCSLEFLANSYKKEGNLEIFINGKAINTIKVPTKEEFSKIEVKDISLILRINKIEFHCLEGTDKLKSGPGEKKGKIRQVSIKFKEFRFKDLKVSEATEVKGDFDNLRIVSQDNFLDLIFLPNKPIILSRDLGINLEEFPFFNFEAKLLREVKAKVIIALGIDYTGDGTVDDYLNLEEFGEHNLFELAKEKWQEVSEYENNFVIKKVVLLVYPKEEKASKISILRLKNFNFYNDNSLILVKNEKLRINQLHFENVNVKSEVIEKNSSINVVTYFDGAPLSKFKGGLSKNEEPENKKTEMEEVKIFVPLNNKELPKFPYFSFEYALDNSEIQEIKPTILIKKDNQDRLIDLDENLYNKSDKTIEINLKNFKDLKAIILRVRRKDDADCSLPEKQGWYSFQLSEIKFYEKFPYPLKEKELKEKFLNLLQETNPELVKIDGQVFRINDFEGLKSFESLEGETLVKEINLSKGNHSYEKLENSTFDIEWVILEPVRSSSLIAHSQESQMTFKKINPTKYLVKVEGAKNPFWLVFSESFHKQWKLYLAEGSWLIAHGSFEEIVADYQKLKVKEAKHLMKFSPQDIKFLWEKPLGTPHHLVNGYANGWYIEPKKINLPEDFSLVIYFFPQSLFYLGLGISGLTFLGCIVYLIWPKKRKKQYEK